MKLKKVSLWSWMLISSTPIISVSAGCSLEEQTSVSKPMEDPSLEKPSLEQNPPTTKPTTPNSESISETSIIKLNRLKSQLEEITKKFTPEDGKKLDRKKQREFQFLFLQIPQILSQYSPKNSEDENMLILDEAQQKFDELTKIINSVKESGPMKKKIEKLISALENYIPDVFYDDESKFPELEKLLKNFEDTLSQIDKKDVENEKNHPFVDELEKIIEKIKNESEKITQKGATNE
ncbi:hypothetical protein [Mycoplasmopsis cricetuli]|uniref:hypothetical protein n=1 Tax=Mycoplasmopsis cricetuli TaxID=171283 RepID=UPI00046F4647|nr:hypothetical protein [Mycoplasmopsis cricetuli]